MGLFTGKQEKKDIKQAQGVQAVQPTRQPAAGGPAVKMLSHEPYKLACARLDQVRAELPDVESEIMRLASETAEEASAAIDPIKKEAMAIFGEGNQKAEDLAVKTERLAALRRRARVLKAAEFEGEAFIKRHDKAAVRGVLEAAQPVYLRLLADQVRAMVGAALASAAVTDYVDAVSAEVAAANSSGLPSYELRILGDPRDPNSRIALWIAELVNMGFIDGKEDHLAGVCFIARRPDGNVVDTTPKATPIKPPVSPLSPGKVRTAPTPRPAPTQSTDDAPEFPSFTPARPAHEGDGPTASIRMLSDLHYPDRVYRAGETVDWHVNGSRVLVKRGRAEYVVKPAAATSAVAPVAVAPAGTATGA